MGDITVADYTGDEINRIANNNHKLQYDKLYRVYSLSIEEVSLYGDGIGAFKDGVISNLNNFVMSDIEYGDKYLYVQDVDEDYRHLHEIIELDDPIQYIRIFKEIIKFQYGIYVYNNMLYIGDIRYAKININSTNGFINLVFDDFYNLHRSDIEDNDTNITDEQKLKILMSFTNTIAIFDYLFRSNHMFARYITGINDIITSSDNNVRVGDLLYNILHYDLLPT